MAVIMQDTPVETMAVASVLDDDLTCIACGYNLRGLRSDARCAECGLPVAETLVELLSHARSGEGSRLGAASLRQISEGARALVLAGALMLVVCLASMWLNQQAPSWRRATSNPYRVVLLGLTCAAFGSHFMGLWKLGFSDDERASDRRLGVALRGVAIAVVGYVLLTMPAIDVQHPLSLRFLGSWRGSVFPVLCVLGFALPAMQALLWLRIGRLARCLRSAWLHVIATVVVCVWPGTVTAAYFNDPGSLFWWQYVGAFDAAEIMPMTWLWLGRWFWPIRFGGYNQSSITLAWLLITGLMVIGEIGLGVTSGRRLHRINRAEMRGRNESSSRP